jgi:cytochrome P450
MMPFRSPIAYELFDYAQAQADLRREHPTSDVISLLLQPMVDGERLTDIEFKNLFALMVAAGNDTTRYTMAAGMKALIEHPDQMHELRDAIGRGDTAFLEMAVEEILRYTTVTMHFRRTATREVEIHGRTIRPGDKVVMWLVSANHDERQFPDPYRFDIHRSPNEHVTFGRQSPHLCLGAQLARLELKVLFEELLPRIATARIVGPVERLRSNFVAGIKHLPIELTLA